MLPVSPSLLLILSIHSIPRQFLVHFNKVCTALWKKGKINSFFLSHSDLICRSIMTLYTSVVEVSWPWPLATMSLKKAPTHHDALMHKIWDRGTWGGERCLKEMQQKYHQNPQNVFSNWLVHMNCFTILRRLQSQSLSLAEELCFLFFFKDKPVYEVYSHWRRNP